MIKEVEKLADKRQALKAENERLRKALLKIEQHQARSLGDACNLSTVWQLANSALLGCN